MRQLLKVGCRVLVCGLFLLSVAAAAPPSGPPNWKVRGTGFTDGPGDGSAPDVDEFSGISSHLGRFTGEGAHLLDPLTGMFEGYAIYTAADGAELWVEYAGGITGIDVTQPFPFEFAAQIEIVGGSGRLQKASGGGVMTGAFTGVPGELYFFIEGTLDPR
jgi:hypothetical protein